MSCVYSTHPSLLALNSFPSSLQRISLALSSLLLHRALPGPQLLFLLPALPEPFSFLLLAPPEPSSLPLAPPALSSLPLAPPALSSFPLAPPALSFALAPPTRSPPGHASLLLASWARFPPIPDPAICVIVQSCFAF